MTGTYFALLAFFALLAAAASYAAWRYELHHPRSIRHRWRTFREAWGRRRRPHRHAGGHATGGDRFGEDERGTP